MVQATTPGTALDAALTRLLASDPEVMSDPFPLWRELRDASPVYSCGAVLLVTGHADVRALIRDERRLSNAAMLSGTRMAALTARLTPEQMDAYREVSSFESNYVSRSDGEQHDRLRSTAHRVFTPRRITALRKSIERYTDELLAGVRGEEVVDLMPTLAYQLPLMVIAEMLGLPEEAREQVHVWSNQLGRNRSGDDPDALMIALGAMRDFRRYVEEILVPLRQGGHGSDLITGLLQAEESERLSGVELTAMVVILLFAGHETTTNLIATGLLELLRHREQWERLCAEPALAGQATEELLRWVSPVQWLIRVALEDMEVGGHRVARGQTIFPVLAAANRDPAVFAEPEQLDITRTDAGNHVALGLGSHFCLGASLARLEGTVVFERLARRYPGMQLQDASPGWRGNALLRSLQKLPIRLDPGPAAVS